MGYARRHVYAVALINDFSFITDSEFKASLSNISNLQMLVAMEIALRTFFKMNLAHHKVIRVA